MLSFIFLPFLISIIPGQIFRFLLLISFHSSHSHCQFLVIPHLLLICPFDLQLQAHYLYLSDTHRRCLELERLGASWTFIGVWCLLTQGEVTVEHQSSGVKYLRGESTFLWPCCHPTFKQACNVHRVYSRPCGLRLIVLLIWDSCHMSQCRRSPAM